MQSAAELNRTKIEEQLREFPNVRTMRIEKGERILKQEEDAVGIYYILQGRVKVVLLSAKGNERILSMHEAGEFIGEASYFGRNSRIASSYADEDSVVLKIDRASYLSIVTHYPEISMLIIEGMANKIDLMVEQIEQSTFFEAKERLARTLLMLMYKFGEKSGDEIKINRVLTDEELGKFVGVRREVASRLLTKFRQIGILRKENSYLYILDQQLLESLADI